MLKNIRPIVREILTFRLTHSGFILLFTISACRYDKPADPMCRLADETLDRQTSMAPAKHSACLIRLNEQLLSIKHRNSDKLTVPSGTVRHDESSQCAAHRHTWKTTGFNVKVGAYLGSDETQTRYYQCTLAGNFTGSLQTFPVPKWAQLRVSEIQLIDPLAVQNSDWQGQSRLALIHDMFNKIEH